MGPSSTNCKRRRYGRKAAKSTVWPKRDGGTGLTISTVYVQPLAIWRVLPFTMRMKPLLSALALAMLTTACATPSYFSPVEVTRFSSAPAGQVPRGPVNVRIAPGEDAESLELAPYRAAVSEALAAVGYTPAGEGAPYVALVDVERFVGAPGGARRGPVSVGGGASTGSYGSGVGLGIGLDLTPRPADEIDTELAVSIRPAGGGQAIWEGRARFTATANNDYAQPALAADRMAEALFQGFPGNSGETIEVR